MAMARRGERTLALPPRPPGPVVWLHAAPQTDMDAVAALAQRMAQEDVGASFMVTGDPIRVPEPLIEVNTPHDSTSAARAFLDHVRPDVVLWMQGGLLGQLLAEVDSRGIARLLADADARDLALNRSGWLARARRGGLVRDFRQALAVDEDAAARLRRLGLEDGRISVTGPLTEGAVAFPGGESQRARIAQEVGTRPIWFAPATPMVELPLLAEAHQAASRRSHRLLLAIMPRDPAEGEEMAETLHDLGLRTVRRSVEEEVPEGTEVVVADRESELGAWYRLAPMTFMGGTLTEGGGRSPYEAAALGSAVLHGPGTMPWGLAYRRLAEARAAERVSDSATLGVAVTELLAPDRAALLAHAAWSSLSSGADVTNRLMELLIDALDAAGAY
ncbi:3-deoxy-D-manno-octulosonic acid transferase [Histidinibacterium aquaticum]|uniref:3-deoxy-D-manno-octulosonic acid transferase n=1 Tax=Histidinibacterium aquaticum TaxID=2613962 RepID=A0A5J5GCU0_9RHOB|nr:glycosyltransferase N-terminal domain-containing protein [Histidinibacterium aquaticum]KAA9005975.1 3-deoxy-D-manno-octulosonic acid transferase [Histidinibacterium aquaticum]